jgi:hypothetical protein
MEAFFPLVNTAYNLVVEYCTIQKIMFYIGDFPKDGQPFFIGAQESERMYAYVMDAINYMKNEMDKTIKTENTELIEELATQLWRKVGDLRIDDFLFASGKLIDEYNITYGESRIQSYKLRYYFKDGFIVTSYFKQVASPYIETHAPKVYVYPSIETEEIEPLKKIKTTFTIGQLAYLFRLLYDNDFTHTESLADLAKFIKKHFENKRTGEIDYTNLKNLLSSPTKNDADKVAEWLKDLRIKAINFEIKSAK